MSERPTAEVTRRDAQWVGFVGASTSFATWIANRALGGDVPPEVLGFIQYAVPLGLTAAAAEIRWRTARRRKDPEQQAPAE
jgi:hypothetical protein